MRGRRSISALYDTSDKAASAVQALEAAGFPHGEISQAEENGGHLVTVTNSERVSEAAAIFPQHGGSLTDGDSTAYEATQVAADDDVNEAGATAVPVDSGMSEPGTTKPLGGGTFTSGSGAGGSGSGTATAGSLFGSSR